MILCFTAVACVVAPPGVAGLGNPGAHGFAEILYAYTSATATNGSAFAGLSANTPFYNLTLALAMFLGRFMVIVPVLAVAGSLAAQPSRPALDRYLADRWGAVSSASSLVSSSSSARLTYLPALALGPIVESLQILGSLR